MSLNKLIGQQGQVSHPDKPQNKQSCVSDANIFIADISILVLKRLKQSGNSSNHISGRIMLDIQAIIATDHNPKGVPEISWWLRLRPPLGRQTPPEASNGSTGRRHQQIFQNNSFFMCSERAVLMWNTSGFNVGYKLVAYT